MLITLSGLDGAGKSTLIQRLRGSLERDGHRVSVLHINRHVGLYAYARYVRDRLFGANGTRPETPSRLWRVRTAMVWSKALRQAVYLVDLVLFLGYRFYLETLRRRVLIMDRYFYDSLVDVADGRNWKALRFLERLTPTPDVAFLLAVPPEQAYARKREQPFSYLERRWHAYQVVFPWIKSAVVVANQDVRTTESRIYGAVRFLVDT